MRPESVPESEALIAVLAKVSDLDPRFERRAALQLLKKKSALMAGGR